VEIDEPSSHNHARGEKRERLFLPFPSAPRKHIDKERDDAGTKTIDGSARLREPHKHRRDHHQYSVSRLFRLFMERKIREIKNRKHHIHADICGISQ